MSGFRKYQLCCTYLEAWLGEFEVQFTVTKTTLCAKLCLVVFTTLAIFITLFPCCLTGGGAESGPGEHDATFLTFLVSK